jgi:hypothetical protein
MKPGAETAIKAASTHAGDHNIRAPPKKSLLYTAMAAVIAQQTTIEEYFNPDRA